MHLLWGSRVLTCPCVNNYWLLILLLLSVVRADGERVEHGFSGKFKKEHGEDEQHNAHVDHKIVIGSRKDAEAFDDLSPEEAKRRLGILVKKMDSNRDGLVSREELEKWIHNNMISLDLEESYERFQEIDADRDNFVTWGEYVKEAFGDIDPADETMDVEDKRLLEEDRKYFIAADQDSDGKLTSDEFQAFQNPESFTHMHSALIELTMKEKDRDGDGKINLEEFLDDLAKDQKSEWYMLEKNRFENDYDVDKNGVLEGKEIAKWLILSLNATAAEETEHLMSKADKDGDELLSVEEILDKSDLFVGSEATNHGENLVELSHDEL